MRAFELYEFSPAALGIYQSQDGRSGANIDDVRIPRLTLRHLNKLKHIRNRRQIEHDRKIAELPKIYGDDDLGGDRAEAENERLEHELEMAKLDLERDKLKIENEIDEAELDDKKRQKINSMAMRAVERQKKK